MKLICARVPDIFGFARECPGGHGRRTRMWTCNALRFQGHVMRCSARVPVRDCLPSAVAAGDLARIDELAEAAQLLPAWMRTSGIDS